MKVSKCCKYYTCEEGHSTHWPVIPNIKWRCQKCRELLEASQIWELNDCEILLKGELDELKRLEASIKTGPVSYIIGHWIPGETTRPKPSTDKRKLRTKRRPGKRGGATSSSKSKRGGDRLSKNKKAKGKRQVRRQANPSKKQ